MNDLTVTVTGWVATDPKLHVVPGGTDLVSFRLASTSRYFDRSKNEWVDRETEWFTVRVFRAAAVLVERSLRKGQPVVVVGRLHSNEWKADTGTRTDLVIDVITVGHDLTRGIGDFRRAVVDGQHVTFNDAAATEPEEPPADALIGEGEVEEAPADDEELVSTTA